MRVEPTIQAQSRLKRVLRVFGRGPIQTVCVSCCAQCGGTVRKRWMMRLARRLALTSAQADPSPKDTPDDTPWPDPKNWSTDLRESTIAACSGSLPSSWLV